MTALADVMADTSAWIGTTGTAHRRPFAGLAFCGQRIRDPRQTRVDRVRAERLCPRCWPDRIRRDRTDGKAGAR